MSLAFQKIAVIKRTYRHAHRYGEILAVLFRYGFGDALERMKIERYVSVAMPPKWRGEWQKTNGQALSRRVRLALEELGPSFVKLGQVLSTHPEIVPPDWIAELQDLQENVRPIPFADVESVLVQELGEAWRGRFESFDETPLASASIGQVHRATLAGGLQVVVKVQRPDIRRVMEVDLEIMLHLAALMEREGFASYHPTKMVEEFGRAMSRETDYTVESGQQERFARNFADDPTARAPRIHRELSTARVLAMEFVEGTKPTSAKALEDAGLDPRQTAATGYRHLLEQVFNHGFFHADPHPGNLRAMEDGAICYLDFGMMGRVTDVERDSLADLVVAVAARDPRACTRAFLVLAEYDYLPDPVAVERAMDEMLTQHLQSSLQHLDLGGLLESMVRVVSKFDVRLSGDLLLLTKALSTIEGIGRVLDPEFDPVGQAEPFLRRFLTQRRHPRHYMRRALERFEDIGRLVEELPQQTRELLRMVRRGEITLRADHHGLEPTMRTIDRASRRLSLSLLIVALLVSSSIMVLAGVREIGILGFTAAGIFCACLIVSLMRHDG